MHIQNHRRLRTLFYVWFSFSTPHNIKFSTFTLKYLYLGAGGDGRNWVKVLTNFGQQCTLQNHSRLHAFFYVWFSFSIPHNIKFQHHSPPLQSRASYLIYLSRNLCRGWWTCCRWLPPYTPSSFFQTTNQSSNQTQKRSVNHICLKLREYFETRRRELISGKIFLA